MKSESEEESGEWEDEDSEMLMDNHVMGLIDKWMATRLEVWVPKELLPIFTKHVWENSVIKRCSDCGGRTMPLPIDESYKCNCNL